MCLPSFCLGSARVSEVLVCAIRHRRRVPTLIGSNHIVFFTITRSHQFRDIRSSWLTDHAGADFAACVRVGCHTSSFSRPPLGLGKRTVSVPCRDDLPSTAATPTLLYKSPRAWAAVLFWSPSASPRFALRMFQRSRTRKHAGGCGLPGDVIGANFPRCGVAAGACGGVTSHRSSHTDTRHGRRRTGNLGG